MTCGNNCTYNQDNSVKRDSSRRDFNTHMRQRAMPTEDEYKKITEFMQQGDYVTEQTCVQV